MFHFQRGNPWLAGVCFALVIPLSAGSSFAGTVSDVLTTAQSYASQSVETAEEYWNSAVKHISDWTPGWPSAGDLMGPLGGNEDVSDTDFRRMMDVAGYSVNSVRAEVGIIPETVFEFAQKREISDYDRRYLHRLLRKHKRERSGPISGAERAIIESVLEIQSSKFYDLKAVDVKLLPLPSISFTAQPKDPVLDSNTSYIVEQIRRINERLQDIPKN